MLECKHIHGLVAMVMSGIEVRAPYPVKINL